MREWKDLFEMHSQCFDNIWSRRMEYLRSAFSRSIRTVGHPLRWDSTRSLVQMDHQGAMCPMFYDSQMNSTHVNIMNHSQQGRWWWVTEHLDIMSKCHSQEDKGLTTMMVLRTCYASSFNLNFIVFPAPVSASPPHKNVVTSLSVSGHWWLRGWEVRAAGPQH